MTPRKLSTSAALAALVLGACNRDLVAHEQLDAGAPVSPDLGDAGAIAEPEDTGGEALDMGLDADDTGQGPHDTGGHSIFCAVPLDTVRSSCPVTVDVAHACTSDVRSVSLVRCAGGVRGVSRALAAGGDVDCTYDDAGALIGVRLTGNIRDYCPDNGYIELRAGDVCRALAERFECAPEEAPGWADDISGATQCAVAGSAQPLVAGAFPPAAGRDHGTIVVSSYQRDGLPRPADEIAQTIGETFRLDAIEPNSRGCYALGGLMRDAASLPGGLRLGDDGPQLTAASAARYVVAGFVTLLSHCEPRWVIDGGWAGAPIDRVAGGAQRSMVVSGTHAGAVTLGGVTLPAPPEPRRFVAALDDDGTVALAVTTGVAASASPSRVVTMAGGGWVVAGGDRVERYEGDGTLAFGVDVPTGALVAAAARWDGSVLLVRSSTAPVGLEGVFVDRHGAVAWSRPLAAGDVEVAHALFLPDETFAIGGAARGAVSVGEAASAVTFTADARAALVAHYDAAGDLRWLSTSSSAGAAPQDARITGLAAMGAGEVFACGAARGDLRLGESNWNHPVSAGLFVARFLRGGARAAITAPPTVRTFEASPAVAGLGERVRLSWDVPGAAKVLLTTDPAGVFAADGAPAADIRETGPLPGPTTIALWAIGPGGRARAQISVGSTVVVPPSRLVIADLASPGALVADGTRAYWSEESGDLKSVRLDGSDPRTVVPQAWANTLLVDGDRLRWGRARQLISARTDGTDLQTVPLPSSLWRLAAIEAGEAYAWVFAPGGPDFSGIARVPVDGSRAMAGLVPGDRALEWFDVGSGALVYVDLGSRTLMRAALDGTQPIALASIVGDARVVRVVGRVVYVGTMIDGGASGWTSALTSYALDTPGPGTVRATSPTAGDQLLEVDGGQTYWMSGPALFAVEASGLRVLAVAADLAGFALVPGEVLWLRNGRTPGVVTRGSIHAVAR